MKTFTFRTVLSIITAFVLLMSLSGCRETNLSKDRSLDAVLDKGQLVLGLDENFPPMGYRDEDGVIKGFDIDLAREVCNRLGVELVCRPIDWDKKEEILNSGEIDIIWNGLSVTDERKENMLLSEPYLENELVFAVAKGSDIKSVDDLKGKKVGVQSGSSSSDAIKEVSFYKDITVVNVDDNVTLLNKLRSGEIDSVFLDSIFIYYTARNSEDYVLLRQSFMDEKMAIGFRKGDEKLKNRIQEIMSEMRADGTLSDISSEWFGSDITIVR